MAGLRFVLLGRKKARKKNDVYVIWMLNPIQKRNQPSASRKRIGRRLQSPRLKPTRLRKQKRKPAKNPLPSQTRNRDESRILDSDRLILPVRRIQGHSTNPRHLRVQQITKIALVKSLPTFSISSVLCQGLILGLAPVCRASNISRLTSIAISAKMNHRAASNGLMHRIEPLRRLRQCQKRHPILRLIPFPYGATPLQLAISD